MKDRVFRGVLNTLAECLIYIFLTIIILSFVSIATTRIMENESRIATLERSHADMYEMVAEVEKINKIIINKIDYQLIPSINSNTRDMKGWEFLSYNGIPQMCVVCHGEEG